MQCHVLGFDALTLSHFQLALTIDTVPETLIGKWFNFNGRTDTVPLHRLFAVFVCVCWCFSTMSIHTCWECLCSVAVIVCFTVAIPNWCESRRNRQRRFVDCWPQAVVTFSEHTRWTHERTSSSATCSQVDDNEVRWLIIKWRSRPLKVREISDKNRYEIEPNRCTN